MGTMFSVKYLQHSCLESQTGNKYDIAVASPLKSEYFFSCQVLLCHVLYFWEPRFHPLIREVTYGSFRVLYLHPSIL